MTESIKKVLLKALKERDLILSNRIARIINVEVYGNEFENLEEEDIDLILMLLRKSYKEKSEMDFDPIKIAQQLDEITSYIEKSNLLTAAEKNYFAYKLDRVTDKFEKTAAAKGFKTVNGSWLMGDQDEARYMKNFDEAGTLMGDADEERYMGGVENTVQREAPSVSTREEPPIRDLNTADNPKSTAGWKNPYRNENLNDGNKVASGKTIPKRKV